MKWVVPGLMVLLLASAAQAQTSAPNPAASTLTVSGQVAQPLILHPEDFASWNRISLKAKDRDGKEYVFSGVPLMDVLLKAGAPIGAQLRGKGMSTYLLVRAKDGYQVVFALPELDSAFTDRTILLADQMNGHALPSAQGPFRLVVPGEKKHARWVWGVTALIVKKAEE